MGYCAPPIYDFAYIALQRSWDKIGEKSNHGYAMPISDVVALNSQLIEETRAYISHCRIRAASDSLLGDLRLASNAAAYQDACKDLRAVVCQSFDYPLKDALTGADFSSLLPMAGEACQPPQQPAK